MNEPGLGRRCSTAIISASLTSSWFGRSFIDQPTTKRVYKSIITARYNHPERVGMKVTSVTQI